VIEILDFYHASQHLAEVAAGVYGAQSEVGQQWLDKQCHALRHEGLGLLVLCRGKRRGYT